MVNNNELAHHSTASTYDKTKIITVKGTVTGQQMLRAGADPIIRKRAGPNHYFSEIDFLNRMPSAAPAESELEPQRELNLPPVSVRSRCGKDACRGADVSARKNVEIRRIKVRVIQQVENLRPELQIQSIVQRNPFEQ